MNKDLTTGNPSRILWRCCLPLFGSVIFQQLYNIADSFVAGKFIGEEALAAVGNSYEVTLIFIAFAFGCNIGCSVIVSQLFGAKRMKDLKTAVYTTMIATGVLCGLLMLVGLVFCTGLLHLINTPANIIADSALYLRIYICGLPFVFYYNVSTGIFSALGDSKTPFIFLTISSISNIVMDIVFVTALSSVFTRGVDGVAWATFICQGVSCLFALYFVLKRLKTIETEGKIPRFSWNLLRRIGIVAVPSTLQQSFVSVGNIIIQSIINSFGSGVMAGYSASVKLNNLVITSLITIGNGLSNYTAQNVGARKYERVREGFRAGLKMVWILCIPLTAAYLLAPKALMHVFLDEPTAMAMRSGVAFLRLLSPFYFMVGAKLISDGILRGEGRMVSFMVATFTDLVLRVVLAKLLSLQFGWFGIWLAWPIGWFAATLCSVGFCRKSFRQQRAQIDRDSGQT